MTNWTQKAPLVSAFVLGAICALGFAPSAVSPAPSLSLAGLFLLWRGAGLRQAAWRGAAWGLGCFLAGVSWVYVSLAQFSGMAAPLAALATLLFCLYLALFPALAGVAFARWQSGGRSDIALFGAVWMLSEYARGTLFTGFPWLSVGYAQTPPSPLAGYAPILGVYGLSLLTALLGGFIAWLTVQKGRSLAAWLGIAAMLGGGAFLSLMTWTVPTGEPLRVSLVQGNVEQSLKWDPRRLSLSIDRYLELAAQHPSALTVLPETAIPLFFDDVPRDVLQALTRHGDAILGIAVRTREGGYSNGAVALSPQLKIQAYAKRHLVPFGEYAPPGFAWFFRFARIPMADFTAGGTRQAPLEVAGQRIAANICYEDLFGEELLPGLASASLLLNLSNTAWFGDSLAQPQHLQIARLRALETGRVMLRATNTGMTAMILPDGTVAAALPPFTSAVLVVDAQGYTGLTPYARWGNALVLLIACAALLPRWRRRQRVKTRD